MGAANRTPTDDAVARALDVLSDRARRPAPGSPMADDSLPSAPQSAPLEPHEWSPRRRLLTIALAVAALGGLAAVAHVVRPPNAPSGTIPASLTAPDSGLPSYLTPPAGAPLVGPASESSYVTDCESSNLDATTSSDPSSFCECVYNMIVTQSPAGLVTHEILESEQDPNGVSALSADISCVGTG